MQVPLLFKLIDRSRIVIIPCVNPDGRELAQEGSCFSTAGLLNAHGVDLDTDFIYGQLVHCTWFLLFVQLLNDFRAWRLYIASRQHVCAARNACDDESDWGRRLLSVCYTRRRLSAHNVPLWQTHWTRSFYLLFCSESVRIDKTCSFNMDGLFVFLTSL